MIDPCAVANGGNVNKRIEIAKIKDLLTKVTANQDFICRSLLTSGVPLANLDP